MISHINNVRDDDRFRNLQYETAEKRKISDKNEKQLLDVITQKIPKV